MTDYRIYILHTLCSYKSVIYHSQTIKLEIASKIALIRKVDDVTPILQINISLSHLKEHDVDSAITV